MTGLSRMYAAMAFVIGFGPGGCVRNNYVARYFPNSIPPSPVVTEALNPAIMFPMFSDFGVGGDGMRPHSDPGRHYPGGHHPPGFVFNRYNSVRMIRHDHKFIFEEVNLLSILADRKPFFL